MTIQPNCLIMIEMQDETTAGSNIKKKREGFGIICLVKPGRLRSACTVAQSERSLPFSIKRHKTVSYSFYNKWF